jgi:hypothetical protein
VLECAVCSGELERLEVCVRALRHDPRLKALPAAPNVVSALGISGHLTQWFGGHSAFVVSGAVLFALLHALPVVVEVAYAFDRFGTRAVVLACVAFAWMLGATLAGLSLTTSDVRRGVFRIHRPLVVWIVATALLCVGVWPFFPSEPTVQASFSTWPADLGYLKSVFYAWLIGPMFLLWPFHFVLVMQRELAEGRARAVADVLTQSKAAVPPRGAFQPQAWVLGVFLWGLCVLNYVGVNHLFGALVPAPHENLFRQLVLLRAAIWLLLPAVCLWWYLSAIQELKREALVLIRLLERPEQ